MDKRVPFRFWLLSLIVLIEVFLFLFSWHSLPSDGSQRVGGNNRVYIGKVNSEGPAAKAGVQTGDELISINGKENEFFLTWRTRFEYSPGETVFYHLRRDGEEFFTKVTFVSEWSQAERLYSIQIFVISLLVSLGLFLLYHKADNPSVRLLFIFSQVFAVTLFITPVTGGVIGYMRSGIFTACISFLGSTFLHFLLWFPHKNQLLFKWPRFPLFIHLISGIIAVVTVYSLWQFEQERTVENDMKLLFHYRWIVVWNALLISTGIITAIKVFSSIRFEMPRHRMMWIFAGLLLGVLPLIGGAWYLYINVYPAKREVFDSIIYEFFLLLIFAGAFLLILSLIFAILRYRIWETEIIIKRSLIYTLLSVWVVLTFIFTISITDYFIAVPNDSIRVFWLLLISFSLIPARDFLQKRINWFFDRSEFTTAQALNKFDNAIKGMHDLPFLYNAIIKTTNDIFHFNFAELHLVSQEINYGIVARQGEEKKYEENVKAIEKFNVLLKHEQAFSLLELSDKIVPSRTKDNSLIVPLVSSEKITGYFELGAKRSQTVYTNHDIILLQLIAQRSADAIRTAELYQLELEQTVALERERDRIASDLHDDLGSVLTKISILTSIVRRSTELPPKTLELVNEIGDSAGSLIDSMNEIIWAMNSRNDTLGNLLSYIHEYALDYLEANSIEGKFPFPDTIPESIVRSEIRRHVFLIVKESLHNIVKHSDAKMVSVIIKVENGVLSIQIKDDGKGFDLNSVNSGTGLKNLKRRAKEAGGELEFKSVLNGGTTVELQVAL